jgi:hypothetical protein
VARQDEYHELVEALFNKIFLQHQFKYFPQRLILMETFKNQPLKVYLVNRTLNMKKLYLDLLQNFCKGKKNPYFPTFMVDAC